NDEIEKLALERSAMYCKCRLEDMKLPLLAGNLKNVPMKEHLCDEVAMDVDEDEDGTQQPEQVQDEVDLDNEERAIILKLSPEFNPSIAKLNGDIECMVPNLKVIERLDDVEAKPL
ncbi:hypothetical protein PAXINDRAFT_92326, partial [Paxillus involutus ATCC 200175]